MGNLNIVNQVEGIVVSNAPITQANGIYKRQKTLVNGRAWYAKGDAVPGDYAVYWNLRLGGYLGQSFPGYGLMQIPLNYFFPQQGGNNLYVSQTMNPGEFAHPWEIPWAGFNVNGAYSLNVIKSPAQNLINISAKGGGTNSRLIAKTIVPKQGLLLFWNFNNPSENNFGFMPTYADFGNLYLRNISFYSSTNGKINNAVYFGPGEGLYTKVPIWSFANTSTRTSFSVSYWWRKNSNAQRFIIGNANGPIGFHFTDEIAGGTLGIRFRIQKGLGVLNNWHEIGLPNLEMMEINRWYHIVGTFDLESGAAMKLYVDGNLVAAANFGGIGNAFPNGTADGFGVNGNFISNPLSTPDFITFRSTQPGQMIDALGIWKRVLSLEEVRLLYNRGQGVEI